MEATQKDRGYEVVVNRQAQYSIWRADGMNSTGWKDVGIFGSRSDCFAFIE